MSDLPEIVVALRGPYHLHQLDRLIRELQPLFQLRSPSVITLDLSGLSFIGAGCLAVLVATIKDLADQGITAGGSAYIHPNNALVAQYLRRMDFDRLLAHPVPPESFERRPATDFCPCMAFQDGDGVIEVAMKLSAAMGVSCRLDDLAQTAITYALQEIAQNVVQHSGPSAAGVAVAQASRKRPAFELAIADRGIGVRRSLQLNDQYAGVTRDKDALKLALRYGVTSSPEGGGVGLFATRYLLRHNGGEFILRSGDAKLHGTELDSVHDNLATMEGTVVVLKARADRPLEIRKMLEALKQGEPDALAA